MSSIDCITKTCTVCKRELPATIEYFYTDKYGFRAACRECHRERVRSYQKENGDKVRAMRKRFREENADMVHDKQKRWYKENREKQAEYFRRYHEEHREERCEYLKRYRIENKDALKEKRQNNPGRIRAIGHRYRARKLNAEGTHTAADVELQVTSQTDKKGRLICWWCGKPIKRKYHVDHRIPLAKGGSNDPGNLCITHARCNLSKKDKMPWEFNGRLL